MDLEIKYLGDNALLVNVDQRIGPDILQKVLWLTKWIEDQEIEGVIEIVPAYSSLAVFYDPVVIPFKKLNTIVANAPAIQARNVESKESLWEIPVCYDTEFGIDMRNYCHQLNLSHQEVIQYHTSPEYLVYMRGFIPGFLYLGGLDDRLHLVRKASPDLKVPAGSIAIGGKQTGIYSLSSPAGWHVIGQTPVKLFDANHKDIMIIKPGDKVQYKSISKSEFLKLKEISGQKLLKPKVRSV